MLWFNNAGYTNFMMHENEQLMERAKKASEYSYSPSQNFVQERLYCVKMEKSLLALMWKMRLMA